MKNGDQDNCKRRGKGGTWPSRVGRGWQWGGADLTPVRMRPRKTLALPCSRKAWFKQRSLWHALNDRKEMPCQTTCALLERKQKAQSRRDFSTQTNGSSAFLQAQTPTTQRCNPGSHSSLKQHCSQQAGTGKSSLPCLSHDPSPPYQKAELQTLQQLPTYENLSQLCQWNCQRNCLTSLGLLFTGCVKNLNLESEIGRMSS